jgi:hypothetical protein
MQFTIEYLFFPPLYLLRLLRVVKVELWWRIREVSFWWRDCLATLPSYKQLASCNFHQGNSILLWQDAWSQQPLKDTWPHLYSYCISETISLKQAVITQDVAELFHLPLSEEVVGQFHLFQALLASLTPTQDNNVDYWAVSGRTDTLKVSSCINCK